MTLLKVVDEVTQCPQAKRSKRESHNNRRNALDQVNVFKSGTQNGVVGYLLVKANSGRGY